MKKEKKVVEKGKKEVCVHCANKIDTKKDKFVSVSTHNMLSGHDNHAFFHFLCWEEYFNERVLMKAKSTVEGMQRQVIQLIGTPVIKTFLSQIKGADKLVAQLENPLAVGKDIENYADVLVSKLEVEEKIKNGRFRKSLRGQAGKSEGIRGERQQGSRRKREQRGQRRRR